MNHFNRIAILGAAVALMSLSACVWERGRDGGNGGGHDVGRGEASQGDTRDHNRRPCDQPGQGGEGHRDDDCRPQGR